ncbi:uncharacterized protein LOC131021036 [Salvia miltiorrhiza]|uniref:uncharacterized protein LOC131021036 n=1 Tax=Salvia miltiorrhiza TaxID=226208 RepID=UPI0025ABF770|nr:uncharacterized protein LOC131021036 [Salvia miltiorrhiza]
MLSQILRDVCGGSVTFGLLCSYTVGVLSIRLGGDDASLLVDCMMNSVAALYWVVGLCSITYGLFQPFATGLMVTAVGLVTTAIRVWYVLTGQVTGGLYYEVVNIAISFLFSLIFRGSVQRAFAKLRGDTAQSIAEIAEQLQEIRTTQSDIIYRLNNLQASVSALQSTLQK